ncbi:CocE/NonD family hydrolase [Nocardia macrotermitis]|uniref:Cocaine esterase n=1 Tax=Nocardia macrotermitis TaxID=2585198 RepID=A0A7K0D165_9NOCA|nr:CocE/NonD family hydrolase [Nocardia macrotermitis]MQY18972.1 Cocaine esterase [Nocardia macrotermitis]
MSTPHDQPLVLARPTGSYDVIVEEDLRTPMDDGVELLGDLYQPVGADPTLPTIVLRSPYGRRTFMSGMATALASEGFLVFFQSCRGTWGSEGKFTPFVNEQRDGIATHRWVRQQPWFTGRLATFGESYLGYTQWAVAGKMLREDPDNAPEALVLQITMPHFGAVAWENGAFALRVMLSWSSVMDWMDSGAAARGERPDLEFEKGFDVLPLSRTDSAVVGHPIHWYQDWLRHERLSDEYWTQHSHTESVPDVTVPVLMTTGWQDLFLPWQLHNYRQLVEAGNPPRLTIGPWGHRTPEKAQVAHQDTIAFLKETFAGIDAGRATPVRAYETGAEQWHDFEVWPPEGVGTRTWQLQTGGGLGTVPGPEGTTAYTYDPQQPTPALGGAADEIIEVVPIDNAAHEQRADVVAFRSDPLPAALDIAGAPVARIRIRSSATSYDVFVRLTDVYPDGRAISICDGIRRVGSVSTAPTDPAADAEGFRVIEVPLWPTFHQFAAGHQVGVQVSSGAHPRYARNPGTGEPVFDAVDTVVAHQQISHTGPDASSIELPVWTR